METEIAGELWRWLTASPSERADITAAGAELAMSLEYYLCGVFERVEFTRSREIWCDGIINLSIEQLNRRAFRLTGVAYSPTQLAPLEIEFHFDQRRNTEPNRVVVRFGELDSNGEIRWHAQDRFAGTIVANRPRRDRDWAVAVELTDAEK